MSLEPYVLYTRESTKLKAILVISEVILAALKLMSDINNTKFPSFAIGWLSLSFE
jgi:hypothetical protein